MLANAPQMGFEIFECRVFNIDFDSQSRPQSPPALMYFKGKDKCQLQRNSTWSISSALLSTAKPTFFTIYLSC